MLTAEEILKLLELLAERVVISPSVDFPFSITRKRSGYSSDPKIGGLQAKLSIMLEMATKREKSESESESA